jgi:hypothetical protein
VKPVQVTLVDLSTLDLGEKIEDMRDPMEWEPLIKGEIYAFYKLDSNGTYYIASSKNTIDEMIKKNFRDSNKTQVFNLGKNEMSLISDLVFVKY